VRKVLPSAEMSSSSRSRSGSSSSVDGGKRCSSRSDKDENSPKGREGKLDGASNTNKGKGKTATPAGKMANKDGTAAATPGTTARRDEGKEPYSPSQPLDWSENLDGVRRIMKIHKPKAPPTTRKEVGEQPAVSSDVEMEDLSGGSTLEKSREYVRKQREADIRQRLGKDMMAYDAIRSGNIRPTKASSLLGGSPLYAPVMPSMIEMGDGRMLSGELKLSISSKKIITSSFNNDWLCLNCDLHKSRPALRTRGEAGPAGAPQAIILSDQNFSPQLPVTGQQQCLKVLRIEHSGLIELAEELMIRVGNRRVPQGSLILLSSITHLSNVGLSAYIADYLEATRILQERLGRETGIAALPPLLIGGCNNSVVVRELLEFVTWAEHYDANNPGMMEDTFMLTKLMLHDSGEGKKKNLEMRRYRLPGRDGSNIWYSGGVWNGTGDAIPEKIKPATQLQEEKIVRVLIEEIRSKLALDLDPSPTFERGLGLQTRTKQAVDFLIVGSNNASKLARALEERGFSTCLISEPNWRIERGSVDKLAKITRSAIEDMDPATVILQLLDNSTFFGRGRDGSRVAARKGDDSKYHIEGDVNIGSKETQIEHLKELKPLLELLDKRRAIIITPLPRYVIKACCENPEHCSNRRFLDFKQQMLDSLELMRKTCKDFLFYEGKKSIKVLDPCVDIRGMEDSEMWGEDPVHPQQLVYEKIATGVIRIQDNQRTSGPGPGPDHKRRRTDSMDESASSSGGYNARRGRREADIRLEWQDSLRAHTRLC
jgi:hypothetical protein